MIGDLDVTVGAEGAHRLAEALQPAPMLAGVVAIVIAAVIILAVTQRARREEKVDDDSVVDVEREP